MKTWETKSGHKIIRVVSGRGNVFLLTNGPLNILIDTSSGINWPKLDGRLQSLKISHIDYLILTHSHYDHAENAARIKDRYGAKVIIHRAEAPYLINGNNPVPRGMTFFARLVLKTFGKRFGLRKFNTCRPDILVDSTYSLRDRGSNAYILHTPGHSLGSISLIVDDQVAIVGDAMTGAFKQTVFPPFADDPKQLVESWGLLLNTGCHTFLPSHGTANSRELVQKDYDRRRPRC
jgi:glyoxylase-like metal-dependent hydrolase (beta-lactamase superfamily II)